MRLLFILSLILLIGIVFYIILKSGGFQGTKTPLSLHEGLDNPTVTPTLAIPPTTTLPTGPPLNASLPTAPSSAIVQTFNISYFSVTSDASNQAAIFMSPQPYTVKTNITFMFQGTGFTSADIFITGGNYGPTGVSVFTGHPFSLGETTLPPSSSSVTPTPSPVSTAPLSQSNTIQSVSTAGNVLSMTQNVVYSFTLVLYDDQGNVVASQCPNTIIKVTPMMVNNPNAYQDYAFAYSYLLVGGGGGGGEAGGTPSLPGGPGSGGSAGQIQQGQNLVAPPGVTQPQTLPRANPQPAITYSTLPTVVAGMQQTQYIGAAGGAGGTGVPGVGNVGQAGTAGANASVQCSLLPSTLVASGGAGGAGGNGSTPDYGNLAAITAGQHNASTEGWGWGGNGGESPISGNQQAANGQMGRPGYVNLNLYWFYIAGGTQAVVTPSPAPTVCPCAPTLSGGSSTSCAAVTPAAPSAQTNAQFYWQIAVDTNVNQSVLAQTHMDFKQALYAMSPYYTTLANTSIIMTHVQNNNNSLVMNVSKSGTTITLSPMYVPTLPASLSIANLPTNYPALQFTVYPRNYTGNQISAWNTLLTDPSGITRLLNKYTTVASPVKIGMQNFNTVIPIEFNNQTGIVNQNTLNDLVLEGQPLAPSTNYCKNPSQFPSAYSLQYTYNTTGNPGFWVPVRVFVYSTNAASPFAADLMMWYLYFDTSGVIHGLYKEPNYLENTTTGKFDIVEPTYDFKLGNALSFDLSQTAADTVYLIYFTYTDGVIKYAAGAGT